MTTVKYYDQVDDSLLKFAVIIMKTDAEFEKNIMDRIELLKTVNSKA